MDGWTSFCEQLAYRYFNAIRYSCILQLTARFRVRICSGKQHQTFATTLADKPCTNLNTVKANLSGSLVTKLHAHARFYFQSAHLLLPAALSAPALQDKLKSQFDEATKLLRQAEHAQEQAEKKLAVSRPACWLLHLLGRLLLFVLRQAYAILLRFVALHRMRSRRLPRTKVRVFVLFTKSCDIS
jgi:hypothetical protein